jgi:hypothetical protein
MAHSAGFQFEGMGQLRRERLKLFFSCLPIFLLPWPLTVRAEEQNTSVIDNTAKEKKNKPFLFLKKKQGVLETANRFLGGDID